MASELLSSIILIKIIPEGKIDIRHRFPTGICFNIATLNELPDLIA